MNIRHYDDVEVSERYEVGRKTVTEEEIVAFGEQYDRQPFRTDSEAAKDSISGGLVAPGWTTVCIYNRILVEEFVARIANLGSRRADDLQWHWPLRPGATIFGRIMVIDKRPSSHHDDRGYVDYRFEALGDDRRSLVTMRCELTVSRRDADPSSDWKPWLSADLDSPDRMASGGPAVSDRYC
jgi:acyl dehydratase